MLHLGDLVLSGGTHIRGAIALLPRQLRQGPFPNGCFRRVLDFKSFVFFHLRTFHIID